MTTAEARVGIPNKQVENIRVRALCKTPFEKVHEAFTLLKPHAWLGGFPLYDRAPYYTHSTLYPDRPVTPNYRVTSSFDPIQLPLVETTLACVNALAKGRTYGQNSQKFPPFSVRIAKHFLSQEDPPSFSQAVQKSAFELFTDFGKIYPNLTPAMSGIFDVAGADGMVIILRSVKDYLKHAAEKALTRANKKSFNKFSHQRFLHQHLWMDPPDEVPCTAEGFVQTLMLEAKEAALWLADTESERYRYNAALHEADPGSFKFDLKDHIDKLLTDAQQAHLRGEI